MTNKVDFGNVITAMITPFQSDGTQSVDLDEVELLANHLLRNGTDTILLTGSTGEAHQLSDQERFDIIKRVRSFTPKGTKIMVSTGDTNTNRVISNAQKAFELGADAILVAVPEYIKPPQDSLLLHYNAIARSIDDKPMMIYNIPGRTGTEILPETVAKLAHTNPNIFGIKQSLGDMDKVSELKMLCPPDFQIYSGDDSLTLPMLALGARGVVSVASHLEGDLIQRMIQSFQRGNITSAQNLHNLLFPLYKALFMTTNPMPVKEAAYQKGLISSPILRSMGEMPQEKKDLLRQSLATFEIKKRGYFTAQEERAKQIKETFGLQDRGRKYIPNTERNP